MFSNANTIPLPPEEHLTLPVRKRRLERVEAPKKRRRAGLGGLCQLNLDELYIIFAYIYPMDLLNLARTCKSLRSLLIHRSSIFLWKTALRQIEGLPQCPPDLTEPEYTNLVFYNICHNCEKSATTILWNLRRRYCPACAIKRLCHLDSCDEVIRHGEVLPADWFIVADRKGQWADKDQVDAFMRDYQSSSDKPQFLNEKREQYQIISLHARECESWQDGKGRVRRFDLEVLRKDRKESIFERLMQRGYAPELTYYRENIIKKSYKSAFQKHRPLTDSEWDRMRPKWIKIMDNLRLLRLEVDVYRPRRRLLKCAYDNYVMHPPEDSPTSGFLPHVVDLACFSPFRDVIKAPKDIQQEDKPFLSAFLHLPVLVDDWIQKLNSEVSALVKIPFSSWDNTSRDQDDISSSIADEDKLRLACAMFYAGSTGAYTYTEVLSVAMHAGMTLLTGYIDLNSARGTRLGTVLREDHLERTGSIYDRYGLRFLEEAPYIVDACGLDPNAATADDMDRRNARLTCICCGGRILVMNWRDAILHARFYHCISVGLLPLSEAPRWQLVADEHIDAIQMVERSSQMTFPPDLIRCLLCRRRVGDAMLYDPVLGHLVVWHQMALVDIKEGVHYEVLGPRNMCVVEMVTVGGQVTFKVLQE